LSGGGSGYGCHSAHGIYVAPAGRSAYAITPNVPLQNSMLPINVPGLDRSRLPTFLYLWQSDPTLERLGGR
jgi:hypothetical protein